MAEAWTIDDEIQGLLAQTQNALRGEQNAQQAQTYGETHPVQAEINALRAETTKALSDIDQYVPFTGDLGEAERVALQEEAIRRGSLGGAIRHAPIIHGAMNIARQAPIGFVNGVGSLVSDMSAAAGSGASLLGFDTVGEALKTSAQEGRKILEELEQEYHDPYAVGIERFAQSSAHTLGNLVFQVAEFLGGGKGATAIGLSHQAMVGSIVALSGFGRADAEARRQGLEGAARQNYILRATVFEGLWGYATSRLGVSGTATPAKLRAVLSGGLGARVVEGLGETVDEIGQQALQHFNDWWSLPENENISLKEALSSYASTLPEVALQSFLAGFMAPSIANTLQTAGRHGKVDLRPSEASRMQQAAQTYSKAFEESMNTPEAIAERSRQRMRAGGARGRDVQAANRRHMRQVFGRTTAIEPSVEVTHLRGAIEQRAGEIANQRPRGTDEANWLLAEQEIVAEQGIGELELEQGVDAVMPGAETTAEALTQPLTQPQPDTAEALTQPDTTTVPTQTVPDTAPPPEGPVPTQTVAQQVGRAPGVTDEAARREVQRVVSLFNDKGVPALGEGKVNVVADGTAVELDYGEVGGKTLIVPATESEMQSMSSPVTVFNSLGISEGQVVNIGGQTFVNDAATRKGGVKGKALLRAVKTPGVILVNQHGAFHTGYDTVVHLLFGVGDASTLQHELVHRQTLTRAMSDADIGTVRSYLESSGRGRYAEKVDPRSTRRFHEDVVKLYEDVRDGKAEFTPKPPPSAVHRWYRKLRNKFATALGFAKAKAEQEGTTLPPEVMAVFEGLESGKFQTAESRDAGFRDDLTVLQKREKAGRAERSLQQSRKRQEVAQQRLETAQKRQEAAQRIISGREQTAQKREAAKRATIARKDAESEAASQTKMTNVQQKQRKAEVTEAFNSIWNQSGSLVSRATSKLSSRLPVGHIDALLQAVDALGRMPDQERASEIRTELRDALVVIHTADEKTDTDKLYGEWLPYMLSVANSTIKTNPPAPLLQVQSAKAPTVTRVGLIRRGKSMSEQAKVVAALAAGDAKDRTLDREVSESRGRILYRTKTPQGLLDLAAKEIQYDPDTRTMNTDRPMSRSTQYAIGMLVAQLGLDKRATLGRGTKASDKFVQAVDMLSLSISTVAQTLQSQQTLQQIADPSSEESFSIRVYQALNTLTPADIRRISKLPKDQQNNARLDTLARQTERFNEILAERGFSPDAIYDPDLRNDPNFQVEVQEDLVQAQTGLGRRAAGVAAYVLSGRSWVFGLAGAATISVVSGLSGQALIHSDALYRFFRKGEWFKVPKAEAKMLASLPQIIPAIVKVMWNATNVTTDAIRPQGKASLTDTGMLTFAEMIAPGSGMRAKTTRFALDFFQRAMGATDQFGQVPAAAYLSEVVASDVAKRHGLTEAEARKTDEFQEILLDQLREVGATRSFEAGHTPEGGAIAHIERFYGHVEKLLRDGMGGGMIGRAVVQQGAPVFRGSVRGSENATRLAPVLSLVYAARDAVNLSRLERTPGVKSGKIESQRLRLCRQITVSIASSAIVGALSMLMDEEDLDKLAEGELSETSLARMSGVSSVLKSYGITARGLHQAFVSDREPTAAVLNAMSDVVGVAWNDLVPLDRMLSSRPLRKAERTGYTALDRVIDKTVFGRAYLHYTRRRGMDDAEARGKLWDFAQVLAPIRDMVNTMSALTGGREFENWQTVQQERGRGGSKGDMPVTQALSYLLRFDNPKPEPKRKQRRPSRLDL